TMLYREFDRKALDAAYNNTEAVGQARRDQYVAGWTARSDAFRARYGGRLDLRCGTGARQRLDIFSCGAAGAPTVVYIHGGYWQANDKEPYARLGEGLLPPGFHPAPRGETRGPRGGDGPGRAPGGDPAGVFVAGHSAGGHLTAMAMADARVAGGVAISGIFDLEPIRLCYLNHKLRLDPAEAGRNSPILHLPARAAPFVVTVGLGELPELIRQSAEYAEVWTKHGLPGRYLALPGHEPFSILEEMARPEGPILAALKELAAPAR